jgi:flagella basal body P-ring formation protein FlgA
MSSFEQCAEWTEAFSGRRNVGLERQCAAVPATAKRFILCRVKFKYCFSLIICGLLLSCAFATAWSAEIRLRSQCDCDGPVVKLGDVAEVISADRGQIDTLSAIELFPAPAGSKQVFVRPREIQDALILRGVNLTEHRFSGANQVAVTGKGDPAKNDANAQALAAANQKNAGKAKSPANAQTSQSSEVVVALHSIGRGAVVRESDVELQSYISRDPVNDAYTTLDDVIGKETMKSIPVGKPLQRDALRELLYVHKGDVVTVFARSSGICVRTTARARDDGSLGDLIAVESMQDRNAFMVRVCGAREAEVFAHGVQAETVSGIKSVPLAAGKTGDNR